MSPTQTSSRPSLAAAFVAALAIPAGAQPPAAFEAVVREAIASVEAGTDAATRGGWERRRDASGLATLGLATLDRLTYRYAEAERAYERLARDTAPAARAYAALGLGSLRVQQARFADAEPALRRAADALAPGTGRAQAIALLAGVLARTVSIDSSLATYRAADRATPPGDAWTRALVTCNALVARVRASDPRAAPAARGAAREALGAGNRRAASACLAALAQDQERRTAMDSALATFDEVAALQRATRNLSALAVTRQWQGYVRYARGDYAAARAALDEAVALGSRTSTLTASAWARLSLADLALGFGDLASAGGHARLAAEAFAAMGDRGGLAQARRHEGDVALLNRALPAARAAYEAVVRDAPAVFPSLGVHARGRLAAVAMLEGDWVAAERELDAARQEAARLHMPEWRQEDEYTRAVLALERGRLDEAASRLRAVEAIMPDADLGVRTDVRTRLAEVHVRAGRVADGEAELARAADMLDARRRALNDRDLKAAVVETRSYDWDRDLGFATTLAGLARAGRLDAAFRLAEQRRARLLLEALARRRALADAPGGAVGGAAGGAPSSAAGLAEVRRLLPDSTAMLAFVTGRGREPTTVFVLTRERAAYAVVDAVDDRLDDVTRLVGLVAAGDHPTELAARVGDAFLRAPLALVPAHVRRLVVVPDGALHRVPFDALVVGGAPLVERYAVSLAPSAAVAAAWWSAPPRAARPRLLAFGDPLGVRLAGSSGDSTPPRLPDAAHEARDVARYAESAEVYTGDAARESVMRRASLADVGVLHFATHAEVGDWSLLRSALLLAPGDGDDGRLTAAELLGLRIDANLVVLSACRTGSGAVLVGEGLQGLTVPVLEAGAASVVATLWPVGDRSVAPMVALFYRELATGASVGDALHRAKRRARAEGMPAAVWAAFTLTGDARVATALRRPSSWAARAAALPLALPATAAIALGATIAVGAALGAARWARGYGARTRRRRSGERR